jgi:hypothetical protein
MIFEQRYSTQIMCFDFSTNFVRNISQSKKSSARYFRQISNKTPNHMQQSIVKFIAFSRRHCSTCFGHYYAHHQEPFETAVAFGGGNTHCHNPH